MPTAPRPTDAKLIGLCSTLRSCQLFGGLSSEDLLIIAGFVVPLKLGKGDMLFREGDPSRGCYLVQSGAVNVHRVNAAGREQVIHIFRAGESLAEASLASATGYPANARAVESGTVLLIPKTPILDLIGQRPDLALRMLGSMSQHLRVLVGALDDLTLKDVETRLLNWLIKHGSGAPQGAIRLPGTKRVLAAELGTSSETLSRTFARLRAEGLLEIHGNTLRMPDQPAVAARFRHLLGEG